MRIIDYALAWLMVALGTVHCAFTWVEYRRFTLAAVWFFGAGVAIVVTGLINHVRVSNGRVAGLRAVCIASNLLVLAAALMGGYFFMHLLTRNPQAPLLLLVIFGELLFSLKGRR